MNSIGFNSSFNFPNPEQFYTSFNEFIKGFHKFNIEHSSTRHLIATMAPSENLRNILLKIVDDSPLAYQNTSPLCLSEDLKFEIKNISNVPKVAENIYIYFFDLCFNQNNEELFRLLLKAHHSANYPNFVIPYGHLKIELNILSLAIIFNKIHWLNEVPSNIMNEELNKHRRLQLTNSIGVFENTLDLLDQQTKPFEMISNKLRENCEVAAKHLQKFLTDPEYFIFKNVVLKAFGLADGFPLMPGDNELRLASYCPKENLHLSEKTNCIMSLMSILSYVGVNNEINITKNLFEFHCFVINRMHQNNNYKQFNFQFYMGLVCQSLEVETLIKLLDYTIGSSKQKLSNFILMTNSLKATLLPILSERNIHLSSIENKFCLGQPSLPIQNAPLNFERPVITPYYSEIFISTFNAFIQNLSFGIHSQSAINPSTIRLLIKNAPTSLKNVFSELLTHSKKPLVLPGNIKLKIEKFSNKYSEVDCYLFNSCFHENNEELFRLLLSAHQANNHPKMVIPFGTTGQMEVNIISLAIIFNKAHWLNEVPSNTRLAEVSKPRILNLGQFSFAEKIICIGKLTNPLESISRQLVEKIASATSIIENFLLKLSGFYNFNDAIVSTYTPKTTRTLPTGDLKIMSLCSSFANALPLDEKTQNIISISNVFSYMKGKIQVNPDAEDLGLVLFHVNLIGEVLFNVIHSTFPLKFYLNLICQSLEQKYLVAILNSYIDAPLNSEKRSVTSFLLDQNVLKDDLPLILRPRNILIRRYNFNDVLVSIVNPEENLELISSREIASLAIIPFEEQNTLHINQPSHQEQILNLEAVENSQNTFDQSLSYTPLPKLGSLITAAWFNDLKNHEWFVNQLISSRGIWHFHVEDWQTTKLFDPLINFMMNSKSDAEKTASMEAVKILMIYFKFFVKPEEKLKIQQEIDLNSFMKNDDLTFYKHFILGELINYSEETLGKNLSERQSIEVAESFFSLKSMEFNVLCKNQIYFIKLLEGNKQGGRMPCYLITPDGENTRIELMMACFDQATWLTGVTSDFYGDAQKFLKEKTGLKDALSAEYATISLEQLKKLQACIENAKGKPDFIILERKKMVKSNGLENEVIEIGVEKPAKEHNILITSNNKNDEISQKKRVRDEAEDSFMQQTTTFKNRKIENPDISVKQNSKKRKAPQFEGGGYRELMDSLPTKKAHVSNVMELEGDNSLLAINPLPRLGLNEVALDDLSPDSMWKQISLFSINAVEFVVASRKALKNTLLNFQPLDYPILKFLRSKKIEKEYEICNPSLMKYQQEEVQKQLACQEMNLSRLLAFTMGLGKTRVFLEMVAHWIVEKNGVNLIIVPLSLLEPTLEECKKFFGTIQADAMLTESKNKNGNPVSLAKAIESALKNKNVEGLVTLLRQFSSFNSETLYNALFDQGVYKKNNMEIWNGLTGQLQKHLANLHGLYSGNPEKYDAIIKEIMAALRNAQKAVKNQEWVNSLNFDENRVREWLSTQTAQPFYPGEGLVKTLNFHEPVLHAECALAGVLLEIGQDTTVAKRFQGEALARLSRFSSDKIKICSDAKDLDQLLLNGKNSSSIVITTYGTARNADFSNSNESTLASVVVDEAQKAHTASSKFYEWFSKLSSSIKQNKDKSPSILLVTGTPFENNFTEMWNLLSLANPKGFPESTHNALNKLVDETLKSLVDAATKSDDGDLSELAKLRLIQSFAQFEVLRKEIVLPLVCRARMDDENILRDWNNKVPVRKDRAIVGQLSEKAVQALNITHEQYRTNKKVMDQFTYEHTIKRILLHPDLSKGSFTEKDPGIQGILQLFKGKNTLEKNNFIENSPYLSTLLNSSKFNNFINKKQKGILFVEHVAVANILQEAISHKFNAQKPEIRIFQGSLTKEQRQSLITWFKADSKNQRILILMQEAGGVGLNLPEALKVFKMTINWNPAVDSQAIARALRVGNEGARKIVSLAFDIFFEHHCQAVQSEKLAWEEFFWDKTEDIQERFFLWCKLQLACCFHKYINDKKDKSEAIEMTNAVQSVLEEIFEKIDASTLLKAVKSVTPEFVEEIEVEAMPVIDVTPIYDTSSLDAKKWMVLPLPICGSEPTDVNNSYQNAVKFGHFCFTQKNNLEDIELVSLLAILKRSNNVWRDVIRNGKLESAVDNSEKSILISSFKKINEDCSTYNVKEVFSNYNIQIFEFNGKDNTYRFNKGLDNKKVETIRLYKKTLATPNGKPYYHYDLLHNV